MTEQEWRKSTDLDAMLEMVREGASDRRWRLFLCACCRRLLPLLTEKQQEAVCLLQQAIPVCERWADGLVSYHEVSKFISEAHMQTMESQPAYFAAYAMYRVICVRAADPCPMRHRGSSFRHAAAEGAELARICASLAVVANAAATGQVATAKKRETTIRAKKGQIHILRDLFGNPFRPLPPRQDKGTWARHWQQCLTRNNATVVKLAEAIYADNGFERLPVLADALEEAGYTEPDLLGHCRQESEHLKGCWVVDLILAKK